MIKERNMYISKIVKNTCRVGAITLAILTLGFILPSLLYIGGVIVLGNEDRTFESQWGQCYNRANTLLIENGFCALRTSCAMDQVSVFSMGYPAHLAKGFHAEIFGSTDEKILGQLTQCYEDTFQQTPNMHHVEISVYGITHNEYVKKYTQGAFPKPLYKIEFKR